MRIDLSKLPEMPEASRLTSAWAHLPSLDPINPCSPPDLNVLNFGQAAWDFYRWLEEEWELPPVRPYAANTRNLIDHALGKIPVLMPNALYTRISLIELLGSNTFGNNSFLVDKFSKQCAISFAAGPVPGFKLDIVMQAIRTTVSRTAFVEMMDRFFVPCGKCIPCANYHDPHRCYHHKFEAGIRVAFEKWFDSMVQFGSPGAYFKSKEWMTLWERERERHTLIRPYGLIWLWLHDRGVIDLDYNDFFFQGRDHRPSGGLRFFGLSDEQITAFLERRLKYQGLSDTLRSRLATQTSLYSKVTLFQWALLRHRIRSLTELSRPLNADEVSRAVQEYRVVLQPLCEGAHAPIATTSDLRWGHLVLDSLRFWIWSEAFKNPYVYKDSVLYNKVGSLETSHVTDVENALAEEWPELGVLLPRRRLPPAPTNPWKHYSDALERQTALEQFPDAVQACLRAWIRYRILLGHSIKQLGGEYWRVIDWLAWLKKSGKNLHGWEHWSNEQMKAAITGHFQEKTRRGVKDLRATWTSMKSFLVSLENLDGIPAPAGVGAARAFQAPAGKNKVTPPPLEIVERIFHDGVAQLDGSWAEKRMRLALTICYSLGVRPGEAAEFNLECIKPGPDGYPCWWIPRFKNHSDRYYPILFDLFNQKELVTYYKEWYDHLVTTWRICTLCGHEWNAAGQPLNRDGTDCCPVCHQVMKPRERKDVHIKPQVNERYLKDHPQLAGKWYYLFSSSPEGGKNPYVRATPHSILAFLRRAVYLAAYKSPEGLLQMDTYDPSCRVRFPTLNPLLCPFIAPVDGITKCPLCGREMEPKRGQACGRKKLSIACDGVATNGELFCPKCYAPLADLVDMQTRMFRHSSVDRFREVVGDPSLSATLHGHTIQVAYDNYSTIRPKEIVTKLHEAIQKPRSLASIMSSKASSSAFGMRIEDMSFDAMLGTVIRRMSDVTVGPHWGTFQVDNSVVVTPDTVWSTVDEYYWMSCLVYGMELAIALLLRGGRPQIPPFLKTADLEPIVKAEIVKMKDWAKTSAGTKVLETQIELNRQTLRNLEGLLKPWIERHGSIEALVLKERGEAH